MSLLYQEKHGNVDSVVRSLNFTSLSAKVSELQCFYFLYFYEKRSRYMYNTIISSDYVYLETNVISLRPLKT